MAERVEILNIDTSTQQKTINELKAEIKGLKEELGELTIGSEEYYATAEKLNTAQEELTISTQATKSASVEYADSINGMRIQLQQMQAELRNMSTTDPKFEEKASQAAALSDKLNAASQQIGNYKDNIGRYSDSFQQAFSAMGMSATGVIGPIKGVSTALKSLAANPIGAIIMAIVIAIKMLKAGFDAVKASVNRNEESFRAVQKAMAPIRAVIDVIRNAFDALIETITKVLGVIGDAVSAFMQFIGIAGEAASLETQIAHQEEENAKQKRAFIVENAQLELDASEARAKAADKEHYNNEERMKFIEEYAAKQKELAANKLKEAQDELKLLELQAQTGANDAAMNDKLAEARAKVLNVQKAYNDTLRETNSQISNISKQIKQEHEKAVAAAAAKHKEAAEQAKKHAEEVKKVADTYKDLMKKISDSTKSEIELAVQALEAEEALSLAKLKAAKANNVISAEQYKKEFDEVTQYYDAKITEVYEKNGKKMQDFYDTMKKTYASDGEAKIIAEQEKWNKVAATIEQAKKDGLFGSEKEYEDALEKLAIVAEQSINKVKEAVKNEDLSAWVDAMLGNTDDVIDELKQKVRDAIINGDIDEGQARMMLEHLGIIGDEAEKVLNEAFVEMFKTAFAEVADAFDEFTGTLDGKIGAIGVGISGLNKAFGQLAVSLKSGEKGWKSYGAVAAAALGAVGQMLSGLAQEQETDSVEGFERQKKLQYAATLMNMFSGIMAAWTSAMALPAPASFIIGGVETAATAALGAAQLAQIAKTQFGSTGSSSASASTQALTSINAPVEYTTDVQGASTERNATDTKVYVLESDITSTQSKVHISENEATF